MGIRVENLHKSFGTEQVLDGITLDIPDRSFFSVVAPTGAGKTTLLRIMAGIESADAGAVHYDGEEMTDVAVQDRSVGMVYQEFINYPSLTVRENLASPLQVSDENYSADEIERRVQETAEMLKIDHILNNLPEEVSGGEAQRTAISRALIKEPDYLFMDEPLANLDYKLREQLRSDFERLFSEEDTTVIYATPQAGDALAMSTHIGFLHDGNIIQKALRDEIYYRPRYLPVAEYLGEPPMNIVPVTLVQEPTSTDRYFEVDDDTRVPATGFDALSPGETYHLGFRPQDMTLTENGAEASITPTLSFVETVGSTSTLHMDLQGREIYALHPTPLHLETGASISFALDPKKFYVYDPEAGDLIAAGDKIPSFS
ncbi:ABC transporter ATP-binding protein [Salinibacter sp.]|uniref:ABC transporter ATP-binding protein n=1 Tax=Salinibacter sp. TaxID=2065818 RepID=UPI0021E8F6F7|nr:ABC transporter ATP-binding protein [Salinibacter sp.]